MQYYISDIRRGSGVRKDIIYANLYDQNHNLVICATIDYIVDAIKERGYELIDIQSLMYKTL